MMNGPFYRKQSKEALPAAKKVVCVPVHFISSMSRESAALKIQKIFRGFLVRNSVNKISSVRKEIVNIEQRLMEEEFINWIGEDPKERLRVNESLMCLVLKLDSIRGFDCGVRDFRKSVTKKAIAVQDKLDSIAQPQPQPDDSNSNKEKENESSEEEEEEEEIDVDVKECVGKGGDCVGSSMEVQKHNDHEEEKESSSSRWEKKICDNYKMMKLMSERMEMQTRMINSLSRRVEHLEKAAFHLTRMKKKKKTRRRGWTIHDD